MTDLATIEASWDKAAIEDAMFNIITDPSKRDGGWTPEEFFAHGRREIDQAMNRLLDNGWYRAFDRALDFGCGVGRLTQALAAYFSRADGVDVSGEMVLRARKLNEFPNAYYHHAGGLGEFPADTFDLVYSMVTLQHMPSDLQQGYVSDFFRVLKPGGVAMFHIPEGPTSGHDGWHLSMYGVERQKVERWILENEGELLDIEDLGMDASWRNLRYTACA